MTRYRFGGRDSFERGLVAAFDADAALAAEVAAMDPDARTLALRLMIDTVEYLASACGIEGGPAEAIAMLAREALDHRPARVH